jgi:protein TonB
MFANVTTAIGSSTVVTFGLLYFMNALIGIQTGVIVDASDVRPIIFTRVPKPKDPPPIQHKAPPSDLKDPPVPPANRAPYGGETVTGIRLPKNGPPPVRENFESGIFISDGPLVALVRAQPAYPAAALRAGLEGWVLVAFDVLTDGSVAGIRVVESSDIRFEDAARRAAAKFRFKPQVVDGVPQVTTDIQNIFRFRMEK